MLRRPFLVAVIAGLLVGSCSQSDDVTSGETTTTPTASTTTTTVAPTTTSSTAPTTTTTIAPTTVAESQAAMVTEKDLVYATWAEGPLTLDMYAPVESGGAPIVIYLLGAADPGAPELVVDGLVDEGTVVFVAWVTGYGGGPEEILGDHGVNIRAMADSVACAIRFARERASEHDSADPVVVLTGFGGVGGVAAHAALFGATLDARWDEYATEGGPPRQVECEVAEGSTHVDALVGVAGAYDMFVPIYDGKWGRAYQQEHDPELWEFLSSSVEANSDLTIRLIHGTTDGSLPYEISAEFAPALTDADYDVQVLAFDGGHFVPPELAVPTIMEVIGP